MLGGKGLVFAAESIYGSWAAALNDVGMRLGLGRRHWADADIADSVLAWWKTHKRLPPPHSARKGMLPMMPDDADVISFFGARSWQHAMQIARDVLKLDSSVAP